MPVYDARKITRESLSILSGLILLSIVAGQVLYTDKEILVSFPVILILIPIFVDSIGDVASIFAARTTTALQLGIIEPKATRSPILMRDFTFVIIAGALTWLFASVMSYILAISLGWRTIKAWRLVFVTLSSGIICSLILVIVAIFLGFNAYKHGWDPDNVLSPVSTTVGDFMGVSVFIIMLKVIGI